MNQNANEFRLAMEAEGLTPPEYMEPGKFYRFPSNGRKSDTAGWCKFFLDDQAGVLAISEVD